VRSPLKWFRDVRAADREQRSAEVGPYSYVSGSGWYNDRHGGVENVSVTRAENLAAVQSAVHVVSSTLASLPARIYRTDNGVRTEIESGPWPSLIGNPYAVLTWSDWCSFMVSSMMMWGNGLAEIVTDPRGNVVALRPLPWQYVTPLRLLNNPALGRLVFRVIMPLEPVRTLLDSEVILFRDRTDDSLIGRSRISRSPGAIRNAEQLQAFSLAGWDNSALPSGTVEIPQGLSKDGFKRLRDQFEEKHTGTANARRVIYLDKGMTWTSLSVSPEDAQVLESRRFSVEEIARLYNVPPPLLQDYTRNTFSNAATAGLWFSQFSLLPIARALEQAFRLAVFGPNSPYDLEIDLSGLTRGEYSTRWASYAIARETGILTIDECRAAEGYGPLPVAADPADTVPMASVDEAVDPGDAGA
jgi:HK97 family phage portal protein